MTIHDLDKIRKKLADDMFASYSRTRKDPGGDLWTRMANELVAKGWRNANIPRDETNQKQ